MFVDFPQIQYLWDEVPEARDLIAINFDLVKELCTYLPGHPPVVGTVQLKLKLPLILSQDTRKLRSGRVPILMVPRKHLEYHSPSLLAYFEGSEILLKNRDLPCTCLLHMLVTLRNLEYSYPPEDTTPKAFGMHALLYHVAKTWDFDLMQDAALKCFRARFHQCEGPEQGKKLGEIFSYVCIWAGDSMSDLRNELEHEYRMRPRPAIINILASIYIGLESRPDDYRYPDHEWKLILRAGREPEAINRLVSTDPEVIARKKPATEYLSLVLN
ncbi:hypothetical protein E4U21_001710 [Claviceps maximensis]|nr:hypothetical protein E4U21_001710 [Claviceps maximensis]